LLTPQAEAEKQARLDREAAALRANLRKRKEQARARAEQSGERASSLPSSTDPASGKDHA
jgi:hypothetical protein